MPISLFVLSHAHHHDGGYFTYKHLQQGSFNCLSAGAPDIIPIRGQYETALRVGGNILEKQNPGGEQDHQGAGADVVMRAVNTPNVCLGMKGSTFYAEAWVTFMFLVLGREMMDGWKQVNLARANQSENVADSTEKFEKTLAQIKRKFSDVITPRIGKSDVLPTPKLKAFMEIIDKLDRHHSSFVRLLFP
ncbi:hypothetical protein PR048_015598 [Dryococelus australis]|uniref:Uncharacterized protein n=1 Tax=Dryococelus australis TaxID=614101 RepID=A0ABQ9HHG5_9NEOP|nr:hypothetical protein PR048_015598 [Dryococelus australis]